MDAIAGGGGLLTVPALMLVGVTPAQAIATNKVQGAFGEASATRTFGREGMIAWRSALRYALISFASGVAGALCVRVLPHTVIEVLIPVLSMAIAIYFALSRRTKDADAQARMTALALGLTAPAAIGFYDGIFGPGVGSFYMLALVTLLGHGVVRATAHASFSISPAISEAFCSTRRPAWSGRSVSSWPGRRSWGPRSAPGSPCGWAAGSSARCRSWSRA